MPPLGDGATSPAAPAADERVEALVATRLAEPFERLRDRADALAAAGIPPAAMVVPIGKPSATGPIAAEIANILAAGGIAVSGAGEPAAVAVICASAEVPDGEIAAAAVALRTGGARRVLLAGRADAALSGVDETFAPGANIVGILARMLDLPGNVSSVQ